MVKYLINFVELLRKKNLVESTISEDSVRMFMCLLNGNLENFQEERKKVCLDNTSIKNVNS